MSLSLLECEKRVLFPESLETKDNGGVFEYFSAGRAKGELWASSQCTSLECGQFVGKMCRKCAIEYRSVLDNGANKRVVCLH